jgi:hypothetical protein
MNRSAPCLAALVLFGVASAGRCATIDSSTIINMDSLFNEEAITVVDGVSPPTVVTLVEGGSVAGFSLRDSSELNVSGGDVTYLSILRQDSVLRLDAGSVSCSEAICRASNYDAVITAEDASVVVITGGRVVGPIRLKDQSTITIVGENLQKSQFLSDWFITGTLADGTELGGILTTLRIRGDGFSPERIILVPESNAAFLALIAQLVYFNYVRKA